MPINRIEIIFKGNFQCRLATNPADGKFGGAAPRFYQAQDPLDPSKTITRLDETTGWTYRYPNETPFDRIIRLSNPIAIRNGLMEPWKDTVVTSVKVDNGVAPQNLLKGKIVSLGNSVKFDARAQGAGETSEKLMGFKLSIGAAALQAVPVAEPPQLPGGDKMPLNGTWKSDYASLKPTIIAGVATHPDRKKLFTHSEGSDKPVDGLAKFYSFTGPSRGAELKITSMSTSALTKAIGDTKKFKWTIDLDFFKFDGDTLVGHILGTLHGVRK